MEEGQIYTYEQHGFLATAYELPMDQYGTQLDPPAHWNPPSATISDIPPTYAIGPLVVIGFAKPEGGTGGYARYVAIAPRAWPHGVSVTELPGAPLPVHVHTLRRDEQGVMRPTPR